MRWLPAAGSGPQPLASFHSLTHVADGLPGGSILEGESRMQEDSQGRPGQSHAGASTDGSVAAPSLNDGGAALSPQQAQNLPPPVNGSGVSPSHIFALGRIEARFPSLGVEKEFAQSTGRAETVGLTDRQALQRVLSDRRNRYLARQLCWVLSIEGLDTYILVPRDPSDLDLLLEALRPTPQPRDLDLVIGVRGPVAPPEVCNGLTIPMVALDQIYSFDRKELIDSIPRPDRLTEEEFRPVAEELFDRISQLADNAGANDEHRALNYLAARYPTIYAKIAELFSENHTLTSVEVRPSRLSGIRSIVDVIFSYTDRRIDVVDRYFCRVDVTEKFPFLVTKLSSFYQR